MYIWAGALAVTMKEVELPDLFLAIIPHPLITNSAFTDSSFTFWWKFIITHGEEIFFWLISLGGHYVSGTERRNHSETCEELIF